MSDPRETIRNCVSCAAVFTQTFRKGGGGTTRLYCSSKCRARTWARLNKDKRKEQVKRYDSKTTTKEKKKARQPYWISSNPHYKKEMRFKKYGLTGKEVQTKRERQNDRCAGCREKFVQDKFVIDHDHVTGTVRGLLCDSCNVALGRVKDSRATLYRLSAYLDLAGIKTPVIYLIGSLRNPAIPELGDQLRSLGIECIDNWAAAGEHADRSWQEYSIGRGKTLTQALQSREAVHVFNFDRAYIDLADAVVMCYPAGRSGHLEFGYAVGQGKKGYMLMEESIDRYDVMLQFAGSPLFHNRKELFVALEQDFKRG